MYSIEFNAHQRGKPFHIEPLEENIEKNVTAFMTTGKERGSGWQLVGITDTMEKAVEYMEAFEKRYNQEVRIRKLKAKKQYA